MWSDRTKRWALAAGIALAVLILYVSRPILSILAVAAILAFLLLPLIDYLHLRLRLPYGLATVVAYLMLLVALALIPVMLGPALIDAVNSIQVDPVAALVELLDRLDSVRILGFTLNLSRLTEPLLESLTGGGEVDSGLLGDLLGSVPGIASGVLGTVSVGAFAGLIALISSIYLALDAHRLVAWARRQVPEAYLPEYERLMRRVSAIWSAYFRGQLILVIIVGVATWLGNVAIGLPGALALGVIAGVLTIIPNLGPLLAVAPAALVALLQGSTRLPVNNVVFAVIVLGLYVIIQMLQGNLILPRLIGQAVDLPPVVVLLGVLVGFGVAGIVGAFLVVPIMATLKVFVGYAYAKLRDREPFPVQAPPRPAAESSGQAKS